MFRGQETPVNRLLSFRELFATQRKLESAIELNRVHAFR
jgi:hypothetical protein